MQFSKDSPLYQTLFKMSQSPKKQIKRLALGTLISFFAMVTLVLTADSANRYLFYFLSLLTVAGIAYAMPGYIGVWAWRMQAVLFKERD